MGRVLSRPLILLTRPKPESEALAEKLQAIGFDSLIMPMLFIEEKQPSQPLDRQFLQEVQAYIVTSVNGARALAKSGAPCDRPLWAVGEKTALVAADLGFPICHAANGDLFSLAEKIKQQISPEKGALLWARGADKAGDLGAYLTPLGFDVREMVLYEARKATSLTPRLVAALRGKEIAGALFFSPRTALCFVTLVKEAGLMEYTRSVRAFALSDAIASPLSLLSWAGDMTVSPRPCEAALLESLASCYGQKIVSKDAK